MNLSVFDDKVPFDIRDVLWEFCVNSTFKLGWEDTDVPEKYDLNIYSEWTAKELVSTNVFPHITKCINETDWFVNKNLQSVVCPAEGLQVWTGLTAD